MKQCLTTALRTLGCWLATGCAVLLAMEPGMNETLTETRHLATRLQEHVRVLTQDIGERSVRLPENLETSAAYIQAQFEAFGLRTWRQAYRYQHIDTCNVVAALERAGEPAAHYVLGAHYDTVAGTVGADDNASAVAVMLETARLAGAAVSAGRSGPKITFAAFTLEEPPVFGTRHMGSRVFAARAKKQGEAIEGMICLEMVGYTCSRPGCQHYPFPLQFFGYPEEGNFIGIVGNLGSLPFTRRLRAAFQLNANLPVVSLTVPFNGWIMPAVRLSDHASFWGEGYRAVMLTDSAFYRNPHYHLPSDTMQTLDFAFMAELVRSLAGFLGVPDELDGF
jgi:hypothetical protein